MPKFPFPVSRPPGGVPTFKPTSKPPGGAPGKAPGGASPGGAPGSFSPTNPVVPPSGGSAQPPPVERPGGSSPFQPVPLDAGDSGQDVYLPPYPSKAPPLEFGQGIFEVGQRYKVRASQGSEVAELNVETINSLPSFFLPPGTAIDANTTWNATWNIGKFESGFSGYVAPTNPVSFFTGRFLYSAGVPAISVTRLDGQPIPRGDDKFPSLAGESGIPQPSALPAFAPELPTLSPTPTPTFVPTPLPQIRPTPEQSPEDKKKKLPGLVPSPTRPPAPSPTRPPAKEQQPEPSNTPTRDTASPPKTQPTDCGLTVQLIRETKKEDCCDELLEKMGEILEETRKEISMRFEEIPGSVIYRSGGSGSVLFPSADLLVAVVSVTEIPSNTKQQPGGNAPRVIYAGWAGFGGGGAGSKRNPLEFDVTRFESLDLRVNEFRWTCYAGVNVNVEIRRYRRLWQRSQP